MEGLNPLEIGSICNCLAVVVGVVVGVCLNPLEIGSICNFTYKMFIIF